MFNQKQDFNVGDLVTSCIVTTASLANTLSDMTEGKQILPEQYYPELYNRYQKFLSQQIMTPRTRDELREVTRKFVQQIIDECNAEGEGEETSI